MAVLFAHLSEPPPSLGSRRPGLPAAVDAVLARGMAKVPEKRFGSCADFADALRGALGLASYSSWVPVPGRPPFPAARARPAAAQRPVVTPPWPAGSSAAATVDNLVPDGARATARTGPGHARSRPRAPGAPWKRRLAPLAAAAVIIAVAATLAAISHPKPGSRPSGIHKAAKLVYAEGGRVPPYYVWISSHGNPNFSPLYAAVRLTATGAVLGTVTASAPGGSVVAVTGAADDRTFVLDEQTWANYNTNANQYFEPRTFYLLRLSASGKPEPVTRLPISVPAGEGMTGLALSPDGTKLAIGIQPDNAKSEPTLTVLKLYSIPAGKVLRTWYANGTIGNSGEDPEALSWTSDQRTLGFDWLGTNQGPEQGEWLLDLSKGGTGLIGNSREALSSSSSTPLACDEDLIVTPDGSAIACGAGNGSSSAFEEFSTTSGKPAQALVEWSSSGQTEVLWSNPSGSVLVGTAPGTDHVGMITAGRFTALPGPVTEVWADEGAW